MLHIIQQFAQELGSYALHVQMFKEGVDSDHMALTRMQAELIGAGHFQPEDNTLIVAGEKLSESNPFLSDTITHFLDALEKHPKLVPAAQSWEDINRIKTHNELCESQGKPHELSSYGRWASGFRDGIERLHPNSPHILMLGAQTPISVQQVLAFTKKYNAKVSVVDNDPGSLRLINAAGLPVNTYVADLTDETTLLPDHDIALSDRILTSVLSGVKIPETEYIERKRGTYVPKEVIARYQQKVTQTVVDNLHKSQRYGSIIVDHANTLMAKGVLAAIPDVQFIFPKEFNILPTLDQLQRAEYASHKMETQRHTLEAFLTP